MKDELPIVTAYDLPDTALFEPSAEAARGLVWRPERTMVVIGKGSDPALEVELERAAADSVPIVRRSTGGCAVVLSADMLVASFLVRQETQLPSKEYFHLFNSLIIEALAKQAVGGLEPRGTSDIALNGRKIAGTAIYRNRELVFFHAIINVAGGTEEMEKYLKVPPRMPDYRRRRSHAEFVTSLLAAGHRLNAEQFSSDLAALLEREKQRLLNVAAQAVKA